MTEAWAAQLDRRLLEAYRRVIVLPDQITAIDNPHGGRERLDVQQQRRSLPLGRTLPLRLPNTVRVEKRRSRIVWKATLRIGMEDDGFNPIGKRLDDYLVDGGWSF